MCWKHNNTKFSQLKNWKKCLHSLFLTFLCWRQHGGISFENQPDVVFLFSMCDFLSALCWICLNCFKCSGILQNSPAYLLRQGPDCWCKGGADTQHRGASGSKTQNRAAVMELWWSRDGAELDWTNICWNLAAKINKHWLSKAVTSKRPIVHI